MSPSVTAFWVTDNGTHDYGEIPSTPDTSDTEERCKATSACSGTIAHLLIAARQQLAQGKMLDLHGTSLGYTSPIFRCFIKGWVACTECQSSLGSDTKVVRQIPRPQSRRFPVGVAATTDQSTHPRVRFETESSGHWRCCPDAPSGGSNGSCTLSARHHSRACMSASCTESHVHLCSCEPPSRCFDEDRDVCVWAQYNITVQPGHKTCAERLPSKCLSLKLGFPRSKTHGAGKYQETFPRKTFFATFDVSVVQKQKTKREFYNHHEFFTCSVSQISP